MAKNRVRRTFDRDLNNLIFMSASLELNSPLCGWLTDSMAPVECSFEYVTLPISGGNSCTFSLGLVCVSNGPTVL